MTDSQDAQDAPADLWIDDDEADLAAGLWPYAEQHESQWHVLSSCTMSLLHHNRACWKLNVRRVHGLAHDNVAAFDVVVADAMTMMQLTGHCSMKSMPSSMSTLTHDVYSLSESCLLWLLLIPAE